MGVRRRKSVKSDELVMEEVARSLIFPSYTFEPKSRKKTSKMDFVKMLLGLAASHLGGLVLCALYAGRWVLLPIRVGTSTNKKLSTFVRR